MRAQQFKAVDPRPTPPVNVIALDLQPILQQSVVDAGWKQEALAAQLGKDPSYLSRQLNGEKPLTLDDLERYPFEIIEAFVARLTRHVLGSEDVLTQAAESFSAAARDAVRVLRLFTPRMRMASAKEK